MEPRFNEVAGDRPNLFVKSRVRYSENLDITNLRGNDKNVRYIEGSLYQKPRYNELEGKRPNCSLYRGHS